MSFIYRIISNELYLFILLILWIYISFDAMFDLIF